MTAVLPSLCHLTSNDYIHVYEPSDDTYLMCDALLKQVEFIEQMKPRIIIEIGSGSGCIITV